MSRKKKVQAKAKQSKKVYHEEDMADDELEKVESDAEDKPLLVKLNYRPEIPPRSSNQSFILKIDEDGNYDNDSRKCKCAKYKETIHRLKEKLENVNNKPRYYSTDVNIVSDNKEIKIAPTKIKCWWDCHYFDNLPFYLPDVYVNETYHVIGCFCSPNCALAYNLYTLNDNNIYTRKSLVFRLYKKITGMKASDNIEFVIPPFKEVLEDFGGKMSIELFREKFNCIDKHFTIFNPPIKPYNMIVEEKTMNDMIEQDNKYVLKRKKPLVKCKTLLTTMN